MINSQSVLCFTVQLEELLEPYLSSTNLGLPYWDWTTNPALPDLWTTTLSQIKDPYHLTYSSNSIPNVNIFDPNGVCQNISSKYTNIYLVSMRWGI